MTQPPLIAVDIGNSSTKIGWAFALAKASTLLSPQQTRSFITGQSPPDGVPADLPPQPCRWHIASVHREGTRQLTAWLQANRPNDELLFLAASHLPIAARVEFPDRVGIDRLAAAMAANVLRTPNVPAIVIDAGSAITVDLLAADGAFEGGVILPGFRMSAEALSTADLLPVAPFSPSDPPPAVVGKDTVGAIRSGLFWGAVGAVREIVERMSAGLAQPPQIFITGGDLRQLAQQLGDKATFVPNLVLSGIALAGTRG
jgi:type III pantothenate kinase